MDVNELVALRDNLKAKMPAISTALFAMVGTESNYVEIFNNYMMTSETVARLDQTIAHLANAKSNAVTEAAPVKEAGKKVEFKEVK